MVLYDKTTWCLLDLLLKKLWLLSSPSAFSSRSSSTKAFLLVLLSHILMVGYSRCQLFIFYMWSLSLAGDCLISVAIFFYRAASKWQLWARTKGIKSEENSDNREIFIAQMGNQWHSRVCLRWATTWGFLFSHPSWGSCSKAWEWGFHISICESEAWCCLFSHIFSYQNLCTKWSTTCLSTWNV